jgi:ribosomal protein S18 acetylase RimI-like enzyme
MPERHAVVDPGDLLPFVVGNSRPGFGAAPPFLLTLSRGPEGVFDLHDDGGRALVAVLTDACDNSGDAVGLVVLASRDEAPGEDLLALLLDEALVEARLGRRSHIEVALEGALRPHEALLQTRGLVRRFDLITMERYGPWQAVEPPASWTWADLSAERYDEAAVLVRAAFAGHPGVNFPPPEQGRAHALGKSPPVRLLLDRARVAGWVSMRAEADGSAMVESLARHPADRGRGLGAALLTEALRRLEMSGCALVRLHVAAANVGALVLYERFGFQATQTMPVYSMATPTSACMASADSTSRTLSASAPGSNGERNPAERISSPNGAEPPRAHKAM